MLKKIILVIFVVVLVALPIMWFMSSSSPKTISGTLQAITITDASHATLILNGTEIKVTWYPHSDFHFHINDSVELVGLYPILSDTLSVDYFYINGTKIDPWS